MPPMRIVPLMCSVMYAFRSATMRALLCSK